MKVLFAVHGYKPAWRIGGPVVSVSSLAEGLVRRGHEVTVFTTNSNLDEDLDVPTDRTVDVSGVNVRYFKRVEPLKRYLPHLKYLNKSIGSLYTPEMPAALNAMAPNIDLIHTHLPFNYPTLAASRAAKRWHLPLFYHQRGVLDPERLKFRALKKNIYLAIVEKPILRRATTLIALTNAEVESYRALGVDTPCRVIPNGIDIPLARTLESDSLAAGAFGIAPHHLVLLFMGRLHPTKGADRLLSAFERIASDFPDVLLVLAGPDEFDIERDFKARAQERGLANRVRFPGMVSGDKKNALLHRANLFCLPSDAEGFSMAILEALAHKTAVLISPRCFFPEVKNCGAGLITEPNVDALEGSLRELLLQPDKLVEMGMVGYKLVASEYTWAHVTDKMIDAYEEGIDRFNSGRFK
jgi:glycosyltransferase involved in cell wall biosynthesis